jgi:hypothetical protein
MINMNTNIVEYLQDVDFLQLPSTEKNEIKNLDHAKPDMCLPSLLGVETFWWAQCY